LIPLRLGVEKEEGAPGGCFVMHRSIGLLENYQLASSRFPGSMYLHKPKPKGPTPATANRNMVVFEKDLAGTDRHQKEEELGNHY
jgi:hypothetical protein